ncbi:MAG: hypothetical protein LBT98_01465 [Puniceicoccales bacterium]|nr:hypothetical protein [Puniceicoccales bacterium]
MLAKIEKTETTRAILYLITGVILAILGVTLSLAIVASAVFLALAAFGVVTIPAFATVAILIATPILYLGSIGSLIAMVFKFDSWEYFCRHYLTPIYDGSLLLRALVITLGTLSGAICGMAFLGDAYRNWTYLTEMIERKRLRKLIAEMNPGLMWGNPDAYIIACLSLLNGLNWTEIIDLRWDQIDFKKGEITFRNQRGGGEERMKINCSPMVILKWRRKIAESEYDLVFEDKNRFRRNYYEFIKWMQNHGFGNALHPAVYYDLKWTTYIKIADFSEIEIPTENDTPEEEINLADFWYNFFLTPLAQDPTVRAILICIINFGLTKEEIANLKWDMIDREMGRITISNDGSAPKIICTGDAIWKNLKNNGWLKDSSGQFFNGKELKKGFRTVGKFMRRIGYTAESKLKTIRYIYVTTANKPNVIKENVDLDLSFLSANHPRRGGMDPAAQRNVSRQDLTKENSPVCSCHTHGTRYGDSEIFPWRCRRFSTESWN